MEENLKQDFTYEADVFTSEGSREVTDDKFGSIGVKAREAMSRILKDEHGIYKVEFKEGYTQYGRNYRLARTNAEIGFVLMGAREEKEAKDNGEVRDMAYYMDSFKKNGIHTNGKDIPTFIDLEEDWKAKQEKKADKPEKKVEKKAENKTETNGKKPEIKVVK